MSHTRRQTKRDIHKTPIFAPTAGSRNPITLKLCTLMEKVVTTLKGIDDFSIQLIDFPAGAIMLIFFATDALNLIPADCHGNLPVIIII